MALPTLSPNSIQTITCLNNKPVFFVTLQGQSSHPSLVIKGELYGDSMHDAPVAISWSSKLMRQANNKLFTVKIMDSNEIAEFKRACTLSFQTNSPQALLVNGPMVWTKMPVIEELTTAEMDLNDATVMKRQLQQILSSLGATYAWLELGKVVAADIFNGNTDRLDVNFVNGNPQTNWSNRGNLLFAKRSIIGLDTFDPNAPNSNLVQPLDREKCAALDILKDSAKQKLYALNVVKTIGEALANDFAGNTAINSFTMKFSDTETMLVTSDVLRTMFISRASEFEQGLKMGATMLKQYLHTKMSQYYGAYAVNNLSRGKGKVTAFKNMMGFSKKPIQQIMPQTTGNKKIPQGILDRMVYLDWL